MSSKLLLDSCLGVAYAAPLVCCSLLSRTRSLRTLYPVMEDLAHEQSDMLDPLTEGAALQTPTLPKSAGE